MLRTRLECRFVKRFALQNYFMKKKTKKKNKETIYTQFITME